MSLGHSRARPRLASADGDPVRCVRIAGSLAAFTSRYPAITLETHSHSIVPGGFEVTSRVTRLMSRTSLVIRVDMRASTS